MLFIGKVQIIFIMMQSDYTTVSTPESVDGYLGLMVGAALWYPLFNDGMVKTTVDKVADFIGDNAKQDRGGSASDSVRRSFGATAPRRMGSSLHTSDIGRLDRLIAFVSEQDERIKYLESVVSALMAEKAIKSSILVE